MYAIYTLLIRQAYRTCSGTLKAAQPTGRPSLYNCWRMARVVSPAVLSQIRSSVSQSWITISQAVY